MEEIKNNEFDKQNKEKDFYKAYLNSLQKRPNSFKLINYNRNIEFTPNVYKHPENIYLRAIYDYQYNKEKMKKYNKKTGQFDLYLNLNRTNKFYINDENKNIDNLNNNDNNDSSNILKTNHSIINSKNKNNKYNKKILCLNINRGNSTKNHYPSIKPSYNTFLTNNSSNIKKNKITYNQNNSNKKSNNFQENREITIEEMKNFLLDKENGKTKQKKINLINFNSAVNLKKDLQQKKKMKMSVNDPLNPYSAIFYNNILYNNYKVKMHYKKLERGVPSLRIKKVKRIDFPFLTQDNNIIEESNSCNTNPSGIKKKKFVLLSKGEINNKNISKKNSDENKVNTNENIDNNYHSNENNYIKNEIEDNKDNKNENKEKKNFETKILFQSYEDNNDFVKEEYEFKKEDININNNNNNEIKKKNKKRLSGIIEEEN